MSFAHTYSLTNGKHHLQLTYLRVYDLLIFIHGSNNQFLERQIKVFVVTSLIFIVIIYFVYAISLPKDITTD